MAKCNYTDTICTECYDCNPDPDPKNKEKPERKGYYEFRWNPLPTRPTKTDHGWTGWATLLYTTNTNPTFNVVNAHYRFHLCANYPCTARWDLGKYGTMPEPTHVRLVPQRASVESAEPSSAADASVEAAPQEAAVAQPPGSAAASSEAVPEEPTVTEPTSSAVASLGTGLEEALVSDINPEGDAMPEVHSHPKGAQLCALAPAAPAAPVDLVDVEAVGIAPDAAPAVAARRRVEARLLELARQIRKPRDYVGYAAFILMGLVKKCRPCVFEGAVHMDLLKVFAPWALSQSTTELAVSAVPCALKASAHGLAELMPICAECPLPSTRHFVGACIMEESGAAAEALMFETIYASMGICILPSVLDGDCAFHVMTMMLGIESGFESRRALRIELSDYLIDRIGEPWMHDIMASCQEVEWADVHALRAGVADKSVKPITAPAVAAQIAAPIAVEAVDEETFEAMRGATRLDGAHLLALIDALPKTIVDEQVMLYRQGQQAIVSPESQPRAKICVGVRPLYHTRLCVAERFHDHLREEGIPNAHRLPYGEIQRFMRKHISLTGKRRAIANGAIQKWYTAWRTSGSAVSITTGHDKDQLCIVNVGKSSSRCSRVDVRTVPSSKRIRAPGGGTKCKLPCVREALYEWFVSIRYAIDWQNMPQLSGGRKLCRFPRSLLRARANQLMLEYMRACLVSGEPAVAVSLDAHWFRGWERDHGLSMRQANRKYSVPRPIVKERMEVVWVTIFRLRYLILLVFGYEPVLYNFDQSPYHHNETGSQDKATLGVTGAIVPVVEGNSDCKSRWTANLTAQSKFPGYEPGDQLARCPQDQLSRFPFPSAECMFKAESHGAVDKRLQAFRTNHNFPPWLTVTTGPKGSYREADVIEWLKRHLEEWKPGRDWRIYMCDDYVCHKGDVVWTLCWSRGYIRVVHGGGTTPVGQVPDTDLNELVRATYTSRESELLLEKMRCGQRVPSLTHEECMTLLLNVLSDPALHIHASKGFKKTGHAVDLLSNKEDTEICREAGVLWNERTTDGYANMRAKIDAELQDLKDEFDSGGLTWCERNVKRLITPYPKHEKVDKVLERLGEDFYHDSVHRLTDEAELSAVATEDLYAEAGEDDTTSDDEDSNEEHEDFSKIVVAGDALPAVAASEAIAPREDLDLARAGANQDVQQTMDRIHAIQGHLEGLRHIGCVRGVQALDYDLAQTKRKLRTITREDDSVRNEFNRLRIAKELRQAESDRAVAERKEMWRDVERVKAAAKSANTELRVKRQKLQELESITACRHAVKSFRLEDLGKGEKKSGGAKGKKNRAEVLDRLSRLNSGLSPGQRNDWQWFKDAWDKAMVIEYGDEWPETFAKWMQEVLIDSRSNAFSIFVYEETCRVFDGAAALQLPGA